MSKYDQDTLVRNHIGLAKSIAVKQWKTAPYILEVDEMVSLAYLGLVDAANRWEKYCLKNGYDPNAVEYFKVYASRRILGTVRDSIRASDWATRTLRDKAKRLKLAGQDEGASPDEMAERSGLSLREVNKTIHRMSVKPVSLNQEMENGMEDARSPEDVESVAFERDMLFTAARVIRNLPQEQQVVLALHYYRTLEIRSVAKELGITESRASQLHTKAVLTVRDALRKAATEGEYV